MKKQIKNIFEEVWLDNRICYQCKTIAYGDGNCHCGKNEWILTDKQGLSEGIVRGFNEGRKQALSEVEKLIDELILECPIQDGKECWCEPLERLKSKIKEMK